MKKLFYINLIFLLTFCNQKAQSVSQIINNEGKTNFAIPKTKLSIINPNNYDFYQELSRLQISENTFIQFSEMDGANFNEGKRKFLNAIESKEKQGGKIALKQLLKIGNYEAVYLIAPQNAKQVTQSILLFGDESFTVMIAGFSPINDEKAQKEIERIILSVYYDKNKLIDLENQVPFSIDLKNSKFKLSKIISGIYFYSVDGNGSPLGDKLDNNFFVQIFPSKFTIEDMKSYTSKFVNDLKNNSFPEKNVIVKKQSSRNYSTDGNEIYETTLENTYQGNSNKMILILKATDKGTILFSGTDLSGKNINLFKEIMNSIEIK